VLREAAAHDDALKIADAGLGLAAEDDLAGSVVPLAHWLRDYVGGMAAPPLKPEPPQPEGSVADHRRSVCIGSRAEVSSGRIIEPARRYGGQNLGTIGSSQFVK
jgi:hypothetical protein